MKIILAASELAKPSGPKMNEEIWKPFPRNPIYLISTYGRVIGVKGRILKFTTNIEGYQVITLDINNQSKRFRIHRAVLETFVGPCPPKHQCAHLNGNRSDNRLENLKWVTAKENSEHQVMHGTNRAGTRHGCAKLSENDVLQIRRRYVRHKNRRSNSSTLAQEFGVHPTTICKIVRFKKWKNLKPPEALHE